MDAAEERLLKLDHTDQTIADRDEDIRGREVRDRDGDKVGTVSDLLVDQTDRKVRFLEIASGGFLGIGRDTTFIPVDAITAITDDEVQIGPTREKVATAPTYDPDLISERETYSGILGYYGYGSFWGADYQYPDYPRYGRP